MIVGISAMHAGWFPAFAVAPITLIIGILLGFPPVGLGLLAESRAAQQLGGARTAANRIGGNAVLEYRAKPAADASASASRVK